MGYSRSEGCSSRLVSHHDHGGYQVLPSSHRLDQVALLPLLDHQLGLRRG